MKNKRKKGALKFQALLFFCLDIHGAILLLHEILFLFMMLEDTGHFTYSCLAELAELLGTGISQRHTDSHCCAKVDHVLGHCDLRVRPTGEHRPANLCLKSLCFKAHLADALHCLLHLLCASFCAVGRLPFCALKVNWIPQSLIELSWINAKFNESVDDDRGVFSHHITSFLL